MFASSYESVAMSEIVPDTPTKIDTGKSVKLVRRADNVNVSS